MEISMWNLPLTHEDERRFPFQVALALFPACCWKHNHVFLCFKLCFNSTYLGFFEKEKSNFGSPFQVVMVLFLLKIGSPSGPPFRVLKSPFHLGTVHWTCKGLGKRELFNWTWRSSWSCSGHWVWISGNRIWLGIIDVQESHWGFNKYRPQEKIILYRPNIDHKNTRNVDLQHFATKVRMLIVAGMFNMYLGNTV